jgi:hypothetical protein
MPPPAIAAAAGGAGGAGAAGAGGAGKALSGLGKLGFGPTQGIGLALGLAQFIGGKIQEKKARKETEKFLTNMPKELEDQGIMGYLSQSQQRAAASPTSMAFYKRFNQATDRDAASNIRNLQNLGRGAAIAGTSTLSRNIADARLKAEEAGERFADQRFAQLGGATQMGAAEKRRIFDLNQRQPWRTRLGMAMQRAGAGGDVANLGAQNMMRALMDAERRRASDV